MLENLKIAVKRQRKLIFIFLLTIFLPAITLSIFGVIAIRNEKFRRAEQVENEHRRAAEYLRSQISTQINDLKNILLRLAQSPAFIEQNYPAIFDSAATEFVDLDLAEEVLLAYKDGTHEYPLFAPNKKVFSSIRLSPLSNRQREQLKIAEENEFKLRKYQSAISGYSRLSTSFSDKNRKAQMLHNMARSYTKLNNSTKAIEYYSRLIREYPDSISSMGLPLSLLAQLQILNCYTNPSDSEKMLKDSLRLYADLLDKPWQLNFDQYKTYTGLTLEKIQFVLQAEDAQASYPQAQEEFQSLQEQHQQKKQRWQSIFDMENHVLPEMMRRITEAHILEERTHTYMTAVDSEDYLILASPILNGSGSEAKGLLGVKINDALLIKEKMPQIIEEMQLSESAYVVISDLSGNILLGGRPASPEISTVTELFEGNSPPLAYAVLPWRD